MNEFLERNYNNDVIKEELNDVNNIYYIIYINLALISYVVDSFSCTTTKRHEKTVPSTTHT